MPAQENPGAGGAARGALGVVLAAAQNTPESTPRRESWQALGAVADSIVSRFRITPDSAGGFDYAPDGDLACCLPVSGLGGAMEDIVAWFPESPDEWWLRRRLAVVLGMEAIERADFTREPLFLYDTPQSWLEGGRRGAVVVAWDAYLPFHLPEHAPIHCQSNRLATRLRHALVQPVAFDVKGPGQWHR